MTGFTESIKLFNTKIIDNNDVDDDPAVSWSRDSVPVGSPVRSFTLPLFISLIAAAPVEDNQRVIPQQKDHRT